MNYRFLGKQKTLALGVWPEVDLGDARAKRDEARRLLAKGIDPGAQAKLDKVAAPVAAANTFQAVADEWLAKIEREDLSPVTLKKNRWLLSFTYAALGRRPTNCSPCCEPLKCEADMNPPNPFAQRAAKSSVTRLQPPALTETWRPTSKARSPSPK